MILFIAGVLILNYLASVLFFFNLCNCDAWQVDRLQVAGLSIVNTLHAVTSAGLVFGFRVTKNWIVEQQVNQQLYRSKVARELKLQKTRLHPRFMLESLRQLQTKIDAASADAPEMILRLSEVLSYLLYDSLEETIPLEYEIEMTDNLVYLEKIRMAQSSSIVFAVSANIEGRCVKPLMLFSALQNCLNKFRGEESDSFEIHFEVMIDTRDVLCLKVTRQRLKVSNEESELTHKFEALNANRTPMKGSGTWREKINDETIILSLLSS